jgi:hypothetical protein
MPILTLASFVDLKQYSVSGSYETLKNSAGSYLEEQLKSFYHVPLASSKARWK